ncbi:MAG: putative bifunctional diguanylate cyclase/phosphodiesterase [Gammaproteobacteria bacterium]
MKTPDLNGQRPAPVRQTARVAAWHYDARHGAWSWPAGSPAWLPDGTSEDLHTLVAHTDTEHGARLTRALSGQDAFRLTLPLSTSSKSERWLRIEGSRDGYGDVDGVIHDVTETHRVEEALRTEIGRYQRATRDGNAVIFTARLPDWRMGHVSEGIEKLTGYPRPTWLGQPDFLRQITVREDRPTLSPAALQDPRNVDEGLRFRIRRADGRIVSLRANLKLHATKDGRRHLARGLLIADGDAVDQSAEERERERHMRVLFDQNPAMFFCVSPDGLVQSVNQHGASHLGYRIDELMGQSALGLHLPSQRDQVTEYVRHCFANPGNVHHWETSLVRKDGLDLWVRVAARAIAIGEQQELLLICEDITEARQLSEKLRYQENFDLLTGLANRRRFERELTLTLEERDQSDSDAVLCYLDLDHFKVINETCGHDVGDQLLLKVSRLLSRHVRECDELARLGGDEFAILFRGCPLVDARRRADEICLALANDRFETADQSFRVTTSIGVVDLTRTEGTQQQLLSFADSACFTAKDQGRNRIVLYQADNQEIVRRQDEMAWVSRLQSAVDYDQFQLFCQPIRGLTRDRGRALEVLLRLPDDEQHSFVRPDEFLRAAENYQLAVRIDSWVCDHVLRFFESNPHAALDLDMCCINLSSQSLTDVEFRERLERRIGQNNPLAKQLCFEITETGVIANLDVATEFIAAIKALGCRFALDDFGSGVSSFAYLKSLAVDVVKIDGMFVRNMAHDPIDRALVGSINDIAHAMNKLTVAEYVEDQDAVKRLREMGVDYAQGFYLAEPRPMAEFFAPPLAPKTA